MIIHWIVWKQEWEKFIQPPVFMNFILGGSIPLFVISQRFMKNNGFLDHLYGGIYYAATEKGIEDNKTRNLLKQFWELLFFIS